MSVALRLFHGRNSVEEELDDWGFDGPILFPLDWVHTTYKDHIKIGFDGDWIGDLSYVEDLVYYDGKFYGDWSVFRQDESGTPENPSLHDISESPVAEKFLVPASIRQRYPLPVDIFACDEMNSCISSQLPGWGGVSQGFATHFHIPGMGPGGKRQLLLVRPVGLEGPYRTWEIGLFKAPAEFVCVEGGFKVQAEAEWKARRLRLWFHKDTMPGIGEYTHFHPTAQSAYQRIMVLREGVLSNKEVR